ncbi:hypothetical protein [Actinomadura parmotrematis]|nr:hypothetical protein [Actinomadura parmotrematis]
MRILIAVLLGVLIAGASSFAVVNAANSTPDPQVKPLYHYGTR